MKTIFKRITSFVLLFAMVAGMASAYTKRAEAAGGWKVTITYYNGESNKTYNNCPTNSTVKLPTPSKTISGASFIGWKLKGTSTLYKAGQIITVKNNMDFLGVWSFYVAFYVDNKLVANIQQKTGYSYGLPANPTKTGYRFVKWVNKANGSSLPSTVTDPKMREVKATFKPSAPDTASAYIDNYLRGIYVPSYTKKLYGSNDTKGGGYVYQHHNQNTNIGMCTPCAIANLLNRRLVLDTGSANNRFDFKDHVLRYLYNIDPSKISITTGDGCYLCYFNGTCNYKEERSFKNSAGRTYTTVVDETIAGIGKNEDDKSKKQKRAKYLVDQLKAHPEGIVLYSTGHAMVLTNYQADGSEIGYTFNAIDTGGSLGSTYKYEYNSFRSIIYAYGFTSEVHAHNSLTNLLNSADYIIYIK